MTQGIFQFQLSTEADTQRLGEWLAQRLDSGVVYLKGNLGAGKTTLTRFWLQALGVTGVVKSPTYTLVEPYLVGGKKVFHLDLYRLTDPEEFYYLGLEAELEDPANLFLVEWPERAASVLPKPSACVTLELTDSGRQAVVERCFL